MSDSAQTKSTTLISLTAFKGWLKMGGVDKTDDDDRMVIACDKASDEIENDTSYVFARRSLTAVFSGTGKTSHFLPWRPVTSVDAITIDGTALSASQWQVDTETGEVWFTDGSAFTSGFKNCSVTATAGYDKQDGPTIPGDVTGACMDLAKAIYDELTTGAIAVSSINAGPSSVVLKAARRPPSVQRVIDSYTNVTM